MEQELSFKLQEGGIRYLTQVEIPVTTVDFYFPLEPRPLLVFVDGRVHLGRSQMVKDEELRLLGQEKRPVIRGNPRQPRKGNGSKPPRDVENLING